MNSGETSRMKSPLERRLTKAYEQLSGLEKEIRKGSKKGDLNVVIKAQAQVSQLRGKLNGLTGADLAVKVAQLEGQLDEIRRKFQQEDYFLTF